jgi:methyl-accepting chemotaxis protein
LADNSADQTQTRWRYYIDREFQTRFMVRFSLVILLVMIMTLGVLFLVREGAYNLLPGDSGVLYSLDVEKPLTVVGEDGLESQVLAPDVPYNAFDLYWRPIMLISVANLILIVIFSLFYSHSMAGPIYNIKRSLRELRDGKTPRMIRVRKGDQFQDLAELLNEVIEKRVK